MKNICFFFFFFLVSVYLNSRVFVMGIDTYQTSQNTSTLPFIKQSNLLVLNLGQERQ